MITELAGFGLDPASPPVAKNTRSIPDGEIRGKPDSTDSGPFNRLRANLNSGCASGYLPPMAKLLSLLKQIDSAPGTDDSFLFQGVSDFYVTARKPEA